MSADDTTSARVGMVGGGQLAQMTHQAAIGLGIELTVLAPSADAPAVCAGARCLEGAPDDPAALRRLLEACDVMTFDHEGVPGELLVELERAGGNVQPSPAAQALAQDKLHARRTLQRMGLPVPAFAVATRPEEVEAFADAQGWPVVLKARSGGYDGRGVIVVAAQAEVADALEVVGHDAVVEAHVAIATEIAVLVARSPSGQSVVYPVIETVQEDGMCRELVVPARVESAVAEAATRLALDLAQQGDATGLMAVELFLAETGELLVNELALRPHNSGHWSIEGAATSQFEQHLRAVLDWPLGECTLRAPAVATVNLVGRDAREIASAVPAALGVAGAHVHLYGKSPRRGRKLGHVTALGETAEAALATARAAVERLERR